MRIQLPRAARTENASLTSLFSLLHAVPCVRDSDIPNTTLYQIIAHDSPSPHQLRLLTGPGCFQWARRAGPHFSQISNSVTQICQRQRATSLFQSIQRCLVKSRYEASERSGLPGESRHFQAAINNFAHYRVFESPSSLHPLKLLMIVLFSKAEWSQLNGLWDPYLKF